MKLKIATLLTLSTLLFGSGSLAPAGVSFSFSFGYHETLAPYGTWLEVASRGRCWRPYAATRVGWRPYLYGHWVYTSYGPTWVSNEPWGWSVYHYGDWVFTDAFGWVWVPGYEWQPADVVWSYGDGYVGWCPSHVARAYGYSPARASLWVFVGADRFTYNDYGAYSAQPAVVQNLLVRKTVQFTSSAPRRDVMERVTRRSIPVQSVKQREMAVDGRRVKMVVPQAHEAVVLKQASMIARKPASAPVVRRTDDHDKVQKSAAPRKDEPEHRPMHQSAPATAKPRVDSRGGGHEGVVRTPTQPQRAQAPTQTKIEAKHGGKPSNVASKPAVKKQKAAPKGAENRKHDPKKDR
ncbi:MAG: DUF6600 domain-containing protein [Acidobacteriota bacterium]